MERKEFLALMGFGAGALLTGCGLMGCKKEETSPAPVDFTLDLTLPENSTLNSNGGSKTVNGVLVAKTMTGSYIGVSAACTHAGTKLNFEVSNNRLHCPNHGSNFTTSGAVINGPAGSGLKTYAVTLNGNVLNVKG